MTLSIDIISLWYIIDCVIHELATTCISHNFMIQHLLIIWKVPIAAQQIIICEHFFKTCNFIYICNMISDKQLFLHWFHNLFIFLQILIELGKLIVDSFKGIFNSSVHILVFFIWKYYDILEFIYPSIIFFASIYLIKHFGFILLLLFQLFSCLWA